jgi:hypothetical protein
MPGQNGAFPAMVLFQNFNVFAFLLLTEGSKYMLYSVTEDINHMSKPADQVQGKLDMLLLKILGLGPMNGFAVSQRLRQVSGDVLQVSGIAIPGSAQVGARRLDHSRVENVRVRPAREILFADSARVWATRKRSSPLGQAFERHFASY